MTKLVLFDIDGTVVNSNGAGVRSMLEAMEAVFGREADSDGYSMSGKTDAQIAVELMGKAGIGREEVFENLDRVWAHYIKGLAGELEDRAPTVCPGVPELLNRLSRHPEVLLGLLTGNVERGAWLKLKKAGVARYFRLGAFGDRVPDRRLLPDVARSKAEALVGRRFPGMDTVIVGDTPNDVVCARSADAVAVAVATGTFPERVLAQEDPDYLFGTLEDTDAALEAMLH